MTIEIQHRNILGFIKDSHVLEPGSKHSVDGKLFGPGYIIEAISEHEVRIMGIFNGTVLFEHNALRDEINKHRYLRRARQVFPSPNITVSWNPSEASS